LSDNRTLRIAYFDLFILRIASENLTVRVGFRTAGIVEKVPYKPVIRSVDLRVANRFGTARCKRRGIARIKAPVPVTIIFETLLLAGLSGNRLGY
jgi:hypothetical protein